MLTVISDCRLTSCPFDQGDSERNGAQEGSQAVCPICKRTIIWTWQEFFNSDGIEQAYLHGQLGSQIEVLRFGTYTPVQIAERLCDLNTEQLKEVLRLLERELEGRAPKTEEPK